MTTARIYRQPLSEDATYGFPWFFTVENVPPTDDAYDYGSVETFDRAIECVIALTSERDGVSQDPAPVDVP